MKCGFLLAEASWEVIRGSIDESVEPGFVAHHPAQIVDRLDQENLDVVVVEARREYLSAELVARCDQQGVQIAALITHADGDEVADERGVGQRIRQPHDLDRLLHQAPKPLSESQADQGVLAVVWGAQGAPGRTTMAVTLASALAQAGHSVMLVDADPRGGTIAPMLGLLDEVPGFLAACRLASKGELDAGHIRRLRSVYSGQSGEFHVLTGVARMTRGIEAPRDSVDQVIRELRAMYPLVVVDPGSDLVPADPLPGEPVHDQAAITSHLVAEAQHLIVVIEASPVGIARFARAQIDLEVLVTDARRHYWLNGGDPARKALKDQAVLTEALWRYTGVESFVAIPRDDHALRQAVMGATTLSERGGKQPILQALRAEIQMFDQLLVSRRRRSERWSPPDVISHDLPQGRALGPMALWHKLTALR